MTDKQRIQQIDIILKQIKENDSAKCVNVYESNSAIGVLYYSRVDIKSLKALKKNLKAFDKICLFTQVKTVNGTLADNRLEIDKPKKATLNHIDLNTII